MSGAGAPADSATTPVRQRPDQDGDVADGDAAPGLPGTPTKPGRNPKRVVMASVVALVVASASAVLVVRSHADQAAAPAKTAPAATARVERRDLAVYREQAGTYGYGTPLTVSEQGSPGSSSSSSSASPSAGNGSGSNGGSGGSAGGTLTTIAPEGEALGRGQVLYSVDSEPRVLLYGTVPAYRELSAASTSGPDIRQLQENLIVLGFDPEHKIIADGTFSDATLVAVLRWQGALGVDQTGTVKLGTVVFAPGPARVGTHQASLGSVVRTGTAITELLVTGIVETVFTATPGTITAVVTPGTAIVSGTELYAVDSAPFVASVEGTPMPEGAPTDPSRQVRVSQGLRAGEAPAAAPGQAVARSVPVLDLVGSTRAVTTTIAVTDIGKSKVGDSVTVEFPDGTKRPGRLASIGDVATRSTSGSATVSASISVDDTTIPGELISTPVTVLIPSQRSDGVLAVPTNGLVALREGGFAVEARNADGSTRLVAVKTGLYSDSWVEVTGAGLREGMTIVVAS